MLIKEAIRKYDNWKRKQPILLKELVSFVSQKVNRNMSSAAVRNILLDKRSNLNYYSSYARSIYLPFKANREEEVIAYYQKDKLHPIGRYLVAKTLGSTQSFVKGSYIIFASKKQIAQEKYLLFKNNYFFIDNIKNTDQEMLLKLINISEQKEIINIAKTNESKKILDWYINIYPKIIHNWEIKEVVNHKNIIKNFMAVASGNFLLKYLPKPFEQNLIGYLYLISIGKRGNNE